jgi:hypothetical protein
MKSNSRWQIHEVLMALMLFTSFVPSSIRAQDSVINIRLSYKVILNPNNGLRPSLATDTTITRAVRGMNTLLKSYWRGYRMQLTEIVEVGGLGDTNGPSRWYSIDLDDSTKNVMEHAAENDPANYAWRDNAINIYINQGQGGGICSFPPPDPGSDEEIIIVGFIAVRDSSTHLHEIGHFFDLCHTQGCLCGPCSSTKTGTCYTTPGDDEIEDTLPDLPCWGLDQIAMNYFSKNYKDLDDGQKKQVDDVADNVMSYHHLAPLRNPLRRLTEGQLDHWTDAAVRYNSRIDVRDGRAIFVATNGGTILTSNGTSSSPFALNWATFVANQNGNDILIMRPGTYNTSITIKKPMTIRATRQGSVSIVASTNPTVAGSR